MKRIITLTAFWAVLAGAGFGFDTPYRTDAFQSGTCNQSGKGARSGKKTGPQDGSGPIHTPGTGGGTGAGKRNGRR